MRRHLAFLGALTAAALSGLSAFAADPGISSDKIILGQAAPLEGPASALGIGMRGGILTEFSEQNIKSGELKP